MYVLCYVKKTGHFYNFNSNNGFRYQLSCSVVWDNLLHRISDKFEIFIHDALILLNHVRMLVHAARVYNTFTYFFLRLIYFSPTNMIGQTTHWCTLRHLQAGRSLSKVFERTPVPQLQPIYNTHITSYYKNAIQSKSFFLNIVESLK